MLKVEELAWAKMDGLMPAIVQDAFDGRLLMQAFMNQEALETTLERGQVTFWSRSRSSLWTKGETSGNFLELVDVIADCDGGIAGAGPTCWPGMPPRQRHLLRLR